LVLPFEAAKRAAVLVSRVSMCRRSVLVGATPSR